MRRLSTSILSVFALWVSFDALAVSVTRGPYLQMATPNSMTVRWRTDVATNSQVRFGVSQSNLSQVKDDSALTTEHEVRLSGLLPNARYWYSVGTTGTVLSGADASTYFNTSPTSGSTNATRVWVIGDAGKGTTAQANVYNAYRNYTGVNYTNLWLMLGDNAYASGTDAEYQAKVFDAYPDLLKQSPVWTTMGNHDAVSADSATQSGPYYAMFSLPKAAEAGGVASGTEAYYSFDYGNIHFVVLDSEESNRSANGTMANWLKADLQKNNADWLIAFWHRPPYSKGTHDSDTELPMTDMRANFLPILENYGVDLVLSGHSHSYERSQFIDKHYGLSNTFNPKTYVVQPGSGRIDGGGVYQKPDINKSHAGTVYAVVGNSGEVTNGTFNHPAMFASFKELGSMVLDINGLTLNAKFINEKGVLRDYFTISKQNPKPIVSKVVNLQNGLNGYKANIDGYLSSYHSAVNFGNEVRLAADGADAGLGRAVALLQWTNLGIPTTAVVDSATVGFAFSNVSRGKYSIYALKKSWSETTVTWKSYNPLNNLGVLIGEIAPCSLGVQQVQLNTAGIALVQDWVSGKAANYGFALVDASTTDSIAIRSSEYPVINQRPMLTVHYH
jgi:acid phosphatase type 7